MRARDQRPPISSMRAVAGAYAQDVIDELKPRLDRVYDAILDLPGNPAELENDALSILADVSAFAVLELTTRLMATKGIDRELATAIALNDISGRTLAARLAADRTGPR